jgi:hypothetical protein
MDISAGKLKCFWCWTPRGLQISNYRDFEIKEPIYLISTFLNYITLEKKYFSGIVMKFTSIWLVIWPHAGHFSNYTLWGHITKFDLIKNAQKIWNWMVKKSYFYHYQGPRYRQFKMWPVFQFTGYPAGHKYVFNIIR